MIDSWCLALRLRLTFYKRTEIRIFFSPLESRDSNCIIEQSHTLALMILLLTNLRSLELL